MSAAQTLRGNGRERPWLHVTLVVALSAGFEALFLHSGLNPLDEGWPLYAAMQLHEGGTLYRDVFFVFPPGHVLSAWLSYAWSPPGLILARIFYAGFGVALCVAVYLLGRRLMPPAGALLAASLVAIAAPDSHGAHYLFGYRYLVFGVAALWCFSERVRTGDRRWMIGAGALVGIALAFRLTPAMSVGAGLVLGAWAVDRRWRSVATEGSLLAVGFALVVAPLFGWLALDAGAAALWREAVVRPIAMTELQSLPVPPLELPTDWGRGAIRESFVALGFRLYAGVYALVGSILLVRFGRAWRSDGRFDSPLLLAVAAAGCLYFLRAFGRSDEAHLDSTLPLALLLLSYLVVLPLVRPLSSSGAGRRLAQLVLVAFFGVWTYLWAADLYLLPRNRGTVPVEALDGATSIFPRHHWGHFDRLVREIRARTAPGDVVLDLSASPLLLVVAGRRGPGFADVVMPGTFLDESEERSFLRQLERAPPELVVMARAPFDRMPSRALDRWAPLLDQWVGRRYEWARSVGRHHLLAPRAPSSGSKE
jgi:hypothetical protein